MILILIVIIISSFFTLTQWIFIIWELIDDEADWIKTKMDLFLWLIPLYMPIRYLIGLIINNWNDLEPKKEVTSYIDGCIYIGGVRNQCLKCNDGELKPSGIALLSKPPQFPHKCNKCGHVENLYFNESK